MRSMRGALWASVLTCTLAAPAAAQGTAEPFAITDNSFFVEEAFNQERGVFQNIFVWQKIRDGGWDANFTQEWPAPAMRHQLSYTIPFDGGVTDTHIGGVLLNYRFQALMEAPGRPAFSPRVSLILPTGRPEDSGDQVGLQINLPFSKQFGDVYLHGNAGVTRLHKVPLASDTTSLTSPQLAGSVIYRLTPMFNLMLEAGAEFAETAGATRTVRETTILVSPGFRTGWNFGDAQVVVGVAVPVTRTSGESSVAGLTYLSYELPFTGNR